MMKSPVKSILKRYEQMLSKTLSQKKSIFTNNDDCFSRYGVENLCNFDESH